MSHPLSAYLELTKPGITLFIGLTAAAGFVTGAAGWGDPARLGLTLAATMLMSGGAATLNQVGERRWDALMRRTAGRPLPSGLISVRAGATFGVALSLAGLVMSLVALPVLTSLFLVLCHASYVLLYTPLKRRTPLCTLAGAIPGALPVLVGWTAAGADIGVTALALTGMLFMWQIPHFLAIGWLAREDYGAAGCPMLGVVESSGRSSARVSLVYAVAMVVCAGILAMEASLGTLFTIALATTGAAYVGFAWRFCASREPRSARRLFFSSLAVLPVLLTALVTDLVVR